MIYQKICELNRLKIGLLSILFLGNLLSNLGCDGSESSGSGSPAPAAILPNSGESSENMKGQSQDLNPRTSSDSNSVNLNSNPNSILVPSVDPNSNEKMVAKESNMNSSEKNRELFRMNLGFYQPKRISTSHSFIDCGILEIFEVPSNATFSLVCKDSFYGKAIFDPTLGKLELKEDGSTEVKFNENIVSFSSSGYIQNIKIFGILQYSTTPFFLAIEDLTHFEPKVQLPILGNWKSYTRKSRLGFEIPNLPVFCEFSQCYEFSFPDYKDAFPFSHISSLTLTNSQWIRRTEFLGGKIPNLLPSVVREVANLKLSLNDFQVNHRTLRDIRGMKTFKRIDLFDLRTYYTPNSSTLVSAWNKSKLCGREDWQINVESECVGNFSPRFGIIGTTGESLWYKFTDSAKRREQDDFEFGANSAESVFRYDK